MKTKQRKDLWRQIPCRWRGGRLLLPDEETALASQESSASFPTRDIFGTVLNFSQPSFNRYDGNLTCCSSARLFVLETSHGELSKLQKLT